MIANTKASKPCPECGARNTESKKLMLNENRQLIRRVMYVCGTCGHAEYSITKQEGTPLTGTES